MKAYKSIEINIVALRASDIIATSYGIAPNSAGDLGIDNTGINDLSFAFGNEED